MADIKRYRDGLEEVPSVRELRTELRDATRSVGRGPQGDPYNVRNVHLAEDETVALLLPGLASTVAERAGSASDASTSGAQDSDPALEKFKRKMAAVGRKVVTSAPAGSASNAVRRTSPKEKLKLVLPPRASTAPAAQMRPAISSAQTHTVQPCEMFLDLPESPSQPVISTHDLINMARSKYRSRGTQLALPQHVPRPKRSVTIMDGSSGMIPVSPGSSSTVDSGAKSEMTRSRSEGGLLARLQTAARMGSLESATSLHSPMTSNQVSCQYAASSDLLADSYALRFPKARLAAVARMNPKQLRELPPIGLSAPRALASSPICASEAIGRRTMSRAAVRRSRSAYNIISA